MSPAELTYQRPEILQYPLAGSPISATRAACAWTIDVAMHSQAPTLSLTSLPHWACVEPAADTPEVAPGTLWRADAVAGATTPPVTVSARISGTSNRSLKRIFPLHRPSPRIRFHPRHDAHDLDDFA
jgi:hypothetical protein